MKHLAAAVGMLGVAIAANPVRADLLLAAFGGDAIYKFDGVTATPFAVDPGGANAMDGPTAMVFDSAGNLLVLNEFSKNVLKFDGGTGAFIGNFIPSSSLLTTAGVTDPADMELGADGDLYIMGHGAVGLVNIHKFSGTTGAYLGAFSTVGADRHQHGLALGPGGDWYQGVVDGRSVERYSAATGAFISTFATGPTTGPLDMFPMADLAFGPSSMYVTIDGTKGVARFVTTPVTGTFTGYLTGTSGATY